MSRKTAAENIDLEFVEFDNILNNRMDPLVPKFAAASPAFVSDYKNARNLVDGGGWLSHPASHSAARAESTNLAFDISRVRVAFRH